MKAPDQKEKLIQNLANMLRKVPFSVEFQVKENPTGIRIIHEVTREQMDAILGMQELYLRKVEKA